jgi:hypothetical protein
LDPDLKIFFEVWDQAMASTHRVWAFSWRQRCCRALAFPSALLFSFMFCIGQETKFPPLALIKAAAEAGAPVAQEKLGSAYQSRGDHYEAVDDGQPIEARLRRQ